MSAEDITNERGATVIDARGQACPLPVIRAKKAMEALSGAGSLQVLVSDEIATENLSKLALRMGFDILCEKCETGGYKAVLTAREGAGEAANAAPQARSTVVCVSSEEMGRGDAALGKALMKGFIFAQTQLSSPPDIMLFYNSGARLTCEGSGSLEDLERLAGAGVTVLTCGTCLNYYGIADKLAVGGVTNMYAIAEALSRADAVIKP